MTKIRNQFYEAQDFDDLYTTLDKNPDVLVSYIPLQMTEKLREMIENIRNQSDEVYINQDILGADRIETILETDDLDSTPYILKKGPQKEYLALKDTFELSHANGHNFNLHTQTMHTLMDIKNGHMPTMALQAGDKNKVGSKKHTDKNTVVFNLYIDGKGLLFDTDSIKNVSLHSPVITAHRGEAHPLCINDTTNAAIHGRHPTKEQPASGRVNIIYAI